MKDNKEKARFFAQYWGQKVLRLTPVDLVEVNIPTHGYLELKNLANITDEDAIWICNMLNNNSWKKTDNQKIKHGKYLSGKKDFIQLYGKSWLVDELRRRGYLVPFNGKTPETIIKKGWAKYEEK